LLVAVKLHVYQNRLYENFPNEMSPKVSFRNMLRAEETYEYIYCTINLQIIY